MAKQQIISISREYGTGGREIAQKIAQDLGLQLYDRNMLEEIAQEKNIKPEMLESVDEKPRNRLLSRRVKGHSNSMEENLAQMQFDFLRKRADSGESFVVLGRCSETVLKDREGLVSIFVVGDENCVIQWTSLGYQGRRQCSNVSAMTGRERDIIIISPILNGEIPEIMISVSIAACLE